MAARFRLGSVLFNLFLALQAEPLFGKISSDPISNGAHSTKNAQHGHLWGKLAFLQWETPLKSTAEKR